MTKVSEAKDLKKVGLKVTIPRLKVLELFEQSEKRHFSAEDIYRLLLESGDEVGIATIYRVLTQFEQSGILSKHKFREDQAVYELNSGVHHDHLLCVKCGKVREFVDTVIEAKQIEIAIANGFKMTDHSLVIYGICSNCLK